LPRKAFEVIGGKRMLDHVIDAAKSAASHLNRYGQKMGIDASVAVLTPRGDQIADEFSGRCQIFQGSESDVLGRYHDSAKISGADLVVRVTGDCPMIPPFVILKLAKLAAVNGYDYLSNVEEMARTSMDGVDCEVISWKMLEYLNDAATDPADREHVTTLARRVPPTWARYGSVWNFFDLSDLKLSVDTQADLDRVRAAYSAAREKYNAATKKYGRHAVHKI